MITISLCMIVKNEADVIGRCLDSVSDLFEEIIIVDTGSTDQTKKIALKYTDIVYDFEWIDDFSSARNYAFSLAESDYCMWLDADDIITEQDKQKFIKLKKNLLENISVVMMPYNTGFDYFGNVTYSYFRERIIKNNGEMKWEGSVHEVIQPVGEIFYSDCAISHHKLHNSDPDRNLRIFEKQIKNGKNLEPRQQFYYARELYYHKRYQDAINVFEDFLEKGEGWIENNIDACCHCAYSYYGISNDQKALQCLFRTLTYDIPRAEVCCDIGNHFFERQNFKYAAYWYTIATTCVRDDSKGGFASPDCYGYIPCIQLCVCYSRMGEIGKAIKFNELAAEFKPDSKCVIHNREYFSSLTKEESID